jgi:hypothetical protein
MIKDNAQLRKNGTPEMIYEQIQSYRSNKLGLLYHILSLQLWRFP